MKSTCTMTVFSLLLTLLTLAPHTHAMDATMAAAAAAPVATTTTTHNTHSVLSTPAQSPSSPAQTSNARRRAQELSKNDISAIRSTITTLIQRGEESVRLPLGYYENGMQHVEHIPFLLRCLDMQLRRMPLEQLPEALTAAENAIARCILLIPEVLRQYPDCLNFIAADEKNVLNKILKARILQAFPVLAHETTKQLKFKDANCHVETSNGNLVLIAKKDAEAEGDVQFKIFKSTNDNSAIKPVLTIEVPGNQRKSKLLATFLDDTTCAIYFCAASEEQADKMTYFRQIADAITRNGVNIVTLMPGEQKTMKLDEVRLLPLIKWERRIDHLCAVSNDTLLISDEVGLFSVNREGTISVDQKGHQIQFSPHPERAGCLKKLLVTKSFVMRWYSSGCLQISNKKLELVKCFDLPTLVDATFLNEREVLLHTKDGWVHIVSLEDDSVTGFQLPNKDEHHRKHYFVQLNDNVIAMSSECNRHIHFYDREKEKWEKILIQSAYRPFKVGLSAQNGLVRIIEYDGSVENHYIPAYASLASLIEKLKIMGQR